MKHIIFAIYCLVLVGCASQPPLEVSHNSTVLVANTKMQTFPNMRTARLVHRSNIDIAEEFLDLSFALESGQNILRLTRFSGPITVSITGSAPDTVVRELDLLLARMKSEAGLNIARVSGGVSNIHVETLPKKQLQSMFPTAACFVVPNVAGWSDYRRKRFKKTVDWTRLEERTLITVFMPNDVSPQESRDCLHEEIAQALGPVKDLYRLPDSVYNDDNFNIALTSYDMLILKAYYASEIQNGMTKSQVAAVLPQILARLNPAGQSLPPLRLPKTSRSWIDAIETALGPSAGANKRRSAASRAVQIAKSNGYNDHRLGFSHYARAQVSLYSDPQLAAADFDRAYIIFKTLFGRNDIHTANAAVQMASLSLSSGKYDLALDFINSSIPAARGAQNGSLLFSLLAMKSEVYVGLERFADAKSLKQEAISWGHYGLATNAEISNRLAQVAALRPKTVKKGI